MTMHFAGHRMHEAWKDLKYSVRTGEPAYRVRGVTNIFNDPLRTPEEVAIFDASMADLTRLIAGGPSIRLRFHSFSPSGGCRWRKRGSYARHFEANPSLMPSFSISPAQPSARRSKSKTTASQGAAKRWVETSSTRFQAAVTPMF